MLKNKIYIIPSVIFLLAFALRLYAIYPDNLIVGFDQARDLLTSKSIFSHGDVKIIGPTAGNSGGLHHGVLWLYFIIPPLFLNKGPFVIAAWNSLFNAGAAVIMYFFSKSLFGSKKAGIIAGVLTAVSYYFVEYSGWLSNPSPTLWTVPLFYLGLWEYFKGKKQGLVLSFFALGLSIQFELFFIYLIPVFIILWVLLRPKFPDRKTALLSTSAFCLATSTMILTEAKYKFSGILTILSLPFKSEGNSDSSRYVGDYITRFIGTFGETLAPGLGIAKILAAIILLSIIFLLIRNWKQKIEQTSYLFLLVYLFSSAIMLFLGYHAAPWFLIGLPPAIILAASDILDHVKYNFLVGAILTFIFVNSIVTLSKEKGNGQNLLEPDNSAIVGYQISAAKYTYESSEKKPFTVNSVTNPLYINAVWAYHYDWLSGRYGYKPTWSGGDQLYPYDLLPKTTGDEKYLYLLMDQGPRIPEIHRMLAKEWADKRSTLIEEKTFGGITVQKRQLR